MKKESPKIIPEKIKIFSINIIKAQFDTSDAFLDAPEKADSYEFGMASVWAHNFEAGRTRIRLFFTLKGLDSESNKIGLEVEYGIEFHFHIDNFQDFLLESKVHGTQMDASLGATILGMAYSTSRGIVFERTSGTFLNGVLLPVIDPFKALKNDPDIFK